MLINIHKDYNFFIPIKWYIILMNEGSFTQNLQYLIGNRIRVNIKQKIRKDLIENQIKNLRYIWLENYIYTKLMYAKSLWKLITYNQAYKDIHINQPIGKLFTKSQTDIYKNIAEIYYGYSIYLEKKFDIGKAIWGRKYILCYNNHAYAIVQEFFSPHIIDFF
uniref:Ycf21 n=1 Tax=Anotrichium furcellatum TaxID=41999 RepID=A0A4D6WLC5_9FLOR|nr:hypothetical protein [Anotrichium furcellatum]